MGVRIIKSDLYITPSIIQYSLYIEVPLERGDVILDRGGWYYLVCNEEYARMITNLSVLLRTESSHIFRSFSSFCYGEIIYLPERNSLALAIGKYDLCEREFPCGECKRRFSCWCSGEGQGISNEDYERFLRRE